MRALVLALLLLLCWPHPLSDHITDAGKMIRSVHTAGSTERVIEMTVTAYTSTDADCGKHDGITATGVKAAPGTIAADWTRYPPGTRLEVPGYGRGVVADRGGGIHNNRLDVWVRDEMTARKFGRQRLKVRILP